MQSETSVPRPLRDLYLRFHERDLCQDLDTVFVFRQKGVEIWCRIEDEKSYQRFSEMIEPLRASFEIDVYATSPSSNEKSKTDEDPPPSLWNNDELVNYLREEPGNTAGSLEGSLSGSRRSRQFVKQRLIMWANQMLSWNKRMQRYATDLPELARLGFGAGAASEIRSRAAAVCLAHAQSLDKNLARLAENLVQALPRPEKAARRPAGSDKVRLPRSPVDLADRVSAHSLAIARRTFRFIYPEDYTVDLSDLKDPGLLESMRDLRRTISEFLRVGASAR